MPLDWLPNIHPLLIHFPIVLLPLAVSVHIFSLALKQKDRLGLPVGILYILGTGSALAAYLSGRKAADTVDILPMANPVLSSHSDLALWTLIIFGIVTVLYWLFQRLKVNRLLQVLLPLVGLFGVGILTITADRGGQLVYRFGTGVSKTSEKEADPHPTTSESSLKEKADGSWLWAPTVGDAHPFSAFRFIEGKAEDINTGTLGVGEYTFDKPVTFIFDKAAKDVQVDVKLNVSSFEGTVAILHHFHSLNQYDFLEISGREMSLGRIQNGKRIDLDTKNAPVGEGTEFRVIGSGRHFKGYMDKKMIVHGHEPPLTPGAVGLMVDGKGTLSVSSIHTIPTEN